MCLKSCHRTPTKRAPARASVESGRVVVVGVAPNGSRPQVVYRRPCMRGRGQVCCWIQARPYLSGRDPGRVRPACRGQSNLRAEINWCQVIVDRHCRPVTNICSTAGEQQPRDASQCTFRRIGSDLSCYVDGPIQSQKPRKVAVSPKLNSRSDDSTDFDISAFFAIRLTRC